MSTNSDPTSADFTNYYELLHVRPHAEVSTIRAAYHRLALERSNEDGEPADLKMLQLLDEAYQTLTDKDKREEYDRKLNRISTIIASPIDEATERRTAFRNREQLKRLCWLSALLLFLLSLTCFFAFSRKYDSSSFLASVDSENAGPHKPSKTVPIKDEQPPDSVGAIQRTVLSSDARLIATIHDSTFVKKKAGSRKHGDAIIVWSWKRGQRLVKQIETSGRVANVAIDSDGERLAAACLSDKSIRVWDLRDGKELRSLRGHKHSPIAVGFSHSNKLLASMSETGNVRVWNASTGQSLTVFGTSRRSPRDGRMWQLTTGKISFNNDDSRLLLQMESVGLGAKVKILEIPETVQAGEIPSPDSSCQLLYSRTDQSIYETIPHPNGHLVLEPTDDPSKDRPKTTFRLIEIGTRKVQMSFPGLEQQWNRATDLIIFSRDGRYLVAVTGPKKVVRIWRVTDGKRLLTINDALKDQESIILPAFSLDGEHLLLATHNPIYKNLRVAIWKIDEEKMQVPSFAYQRFPTSKALSLSTGTTTNKGSKRTGNQAILLEIPELAPRGFTHHAISGLSFDNQGRTLLCWDNHVGKSKRRVTVRAIPTGKKLYTKDQLFLIHQAILSPKGNNFAMVSGGGVTLVDVLADKVVCTFGGFTRPEIGFSPNGNWLLTYNRSSTPGWGGKGTIQVQARDVKSGKVLFQHDGKLFACAMFTPDNRYLLFSNLPGKLVVVDTRSWKITQTIPMLGLPTLKLQVSNAPYRIAGINAQLFSKESDVKVWEFAGKELFAIKDDASFMLSPDGSRLLVQSNEEPQKNQASVIDLKSGKPVYQIRNKIWGFSPDGVHLVTAAKDGTLLILQAATGEIQHAIRASNKITQVAFLPAKPDRLLVVTSSGVLQSRSLKTGVLIPLADK